MSLCPVPFRRLAFAAAVAVVCSFPLSGHGAELSVEPDSGQQTRIVAPIDETRLTTLSGNTRPEARAEFDRGTVSPSLVMGDLFLVLRRSPERQAAFEAFLASQQDSSSPNFHHWLTPDEIGRQFGPAQADIDTVSNWLQNHGLAVSNVSKDRMFIRFDGMAGQVQGAFHTEIHTLNVRGEMHVSNMSDPKIPEALTPVVAGIKALHDFFPHPLHKLGATVRHKAGGGWERIGDAAVKPSRDIPVAANSKQIRPLFGTGGVPATIEDLAPYDLATIYNILPLWNAATPIDGTGQTIAIAGRSNITLSDVATFRSAFGLPAKVPQVIITNTDPGACTTFAATCSGDLVENTLDVEWSGAVARNANIILVTSSKSTTTSDGSFLSEEYIVDNVTAKIMNVSYGECELGLEAGGNTTFNTLWSTAQGAGIAVFVATGDDGAATCDAGQDTSTPYGAQYGLSVNGLASTPYNTAIGGTDFVWGWVTNGQTTYWGSTDNSTTKANALGYIPEFPWNSTCSNFELLDSFNSANNESLSAGDFCDEIGREILTSQSGSILYLVDTVGGGGGASNCINGDGQSVTSCTQGYAKPSWQTGVTGIPSDGVRDIPDVSLFAANGFSGSGYVFCVTAAGSCSYTEGTEPVGEEAGGTSFASPIMAGVMALINQKAGSNQGNPNVELYKLAAKEAYSGCSSSSIPLTGSACIFNDINTGGIAMPCATGSPDCPVTDEVDFSVQSGYSAGTGYDLASGLGSVNVANLVNAFAPSVTPTPAVSLTPTSLTFASTNVGSTAATQVITLKNTGTASLTVSGISITGTDVTSFSETNTCGGTVAAAASCAITVTFKPASAGSLSASVSIADNASGSPQSAALSGTGVPIGPDATFSPTSLTFASTLTGSSAASQIVTLKNTGTAALTSVAVAITGANASSYAQTNTCGTSVGIGASCTITVTFAPTVGGTLIAAVSVSDNATGSPQTVALTGTGVVPAPAVSFSPTSLTFASTAAGSSSPTQAVTLKNTGTAALAITGITVSGTNSAAFTQTNTCGASVVVGGSCAITVTFSPTTFSTSAETATINVADNASGSPQTVSLTGTATEDGSYTLAAAAVTVAPGSSGTSAITGTGSATYSTPNTVTLSSCTLTSSPAGAVDVPTCTIGAATVAFAAGSTSGTGGSVSIGTTAATTSVKLGQVKSGNKLWPLASAGGAVIAGLLFFGIPARRRTWRSLLGVLIVLGALGAISGCGGSGGGGGGTSNPGTTAGTYTFTITGTDSDGVKETTTLTVTVS